MRDFVFILIVSLLFPSCMSVYLNEHSYTSAEPTEINGADVSIALKPMGGKSYASASAMVVGLGAGETDGPFIWRIQATGKEGIHKDLWVNNIKVTTSQTNRSEPVPRKMLKFRSEFVPMKGKENTGKTFANHQFPGKLEVYPRKDGVITIIADVSVRTNSSTKRKTLKFTLDPKGSKGFEHIFIPTEIVNSFGKKDPTEWKW